MVRQSVAAGSHVWLETPWAGAMMRCIADPAASLDEAALADDWQVWSLLRQAQADPFARLKLGKWLLSGQQQDVPAIIAASDMPRIRLAFLPTRDAVCLVHFAAAWLGMPGLVSLLRTKDIVNVRTTLGEDAYAFAFDATLQPRPSSKLVLAVGASDQPSEPAALLRCGAALFGLAMGPIPEGLQARLRLRNPGAVWLPAAESCCAADAGQDAFQAILRIIRMRLPTWSHWFN